MSQNLDISHLVDIVGTTPAAETSQALPILQKLCSKTLEIKTKIISSLSKTSFDDVAATQMSGKGNCKITKEFLAESIISLVKLVDTVEPIINSEPPILHINTSSSVVNTDFSLFDTYMTDVKSRLNEYCDTMQASQHQFDNMIKTLSDLVLESKPQSISEPSNSTMMPNTQSPHVAPSLFSLM